MKNMLKSLLAIVLAFTASEVLAAGNAATDGKYSIFVAVAMVVLLGIFLSLVRLDVKTKFLRKKMDEK